MCNLGRPLDWSKRKVRLTVKQSLQIQQGMERAEEGISVAHFTLPESAAKSFLTTAVEASIGPLSIDLVAVAFAIGPLTLSLNVLTLVGISIVAFIVRSWI